MSEKLIQNNKKCDLRALVSSGNLHDTVGVDLECNLNLRDTTRCRRNAREFEFSKKVVILGQRTFTLEDLDQNSRLIVSSSGEASRGQIIVQMEEKELAYI